MVAHGVVDVSRAAGTKQSSACYLFHAAFSLGLFVNPENGGEMFLQTVADFQRTTRRYIPEDIALQVTRYSNYRSFMVYQNIFRQIS
jgi:hypothetical protein